MTAAALPGLENRAAVTKESGPALVRNGRPAPGHATQWPCHRSIYPGLAEGLKKGNRVHIHVHTRPVRHAHFGQPVPQNRLDRHIPSGFQ